MAIKDLRNVYPMTVLNIISIFRHWIKFHYLNNIIKKASLN